MRALSSLDTQARAVQRDANARTGLNIRMGAPPIAPDWCLDRDTRDNIVARRNVLLALWAGRLMNLPEADLTAYAAHVHFADFAVAGEDDVVLKLVLDLDAAGIGVPTQTVRAKLAECHRQALKDTLSTD
jgi:hypothetical protein